MEILSTSIHESNTFLRFEWTQNAIQANGPSSWDVDPSPPKRQLDRFTHFLTNTPRTPIGYNGISHIHPPKLVTVVGQSPNPTTYLILGPSRPTTSNSVQIWSAVFPRSTGQTDRQTDRPIDRWSRQKDLYNSRLRSITDSDAANNNNKSVAWQVERLLPSHAAKNKIILLVSG